MHNKNIDYTVIKRIIRLISAIILIFVFGIIFKSAMHDSYWFTFAGASLGLIIGLFIVPAASALIGLEFMFFQLWWIKMLRVKPYFLDSSCILDGRIVELYKTGLLDRPIRISSITMDELERLSKSSEVYSKRVKRGLDALEKMTSVGKKQIQILSFQSVPSSIREHILNTAKKMNASIITLDSWITDHARKRKIKVVNLHELSIAFRIQILPKEMFEVALSKTGKENNQAIGYTDDGMMIIIEDGRPYIGKQILAECTSVLQSTSGKIIFGQYIKTLSHE